MANYPTSQPSATPADHAEVLGEVRAIASTLGLSPQGSFTDVASRLTNGAPRDYTIPTGGLRHTSDRTASFTSLGLVSGTVYASGFSGYAGDVYAAANFRANAASSGATHVWAALLDASLTVLAVSADTTTGWSSTSNRAFTFGSSYTVTTSGLFYVAVMFAGTTPGTLVAPNVTTLQSQAVTPTILGTSSTGQTTPPSVGATLAALTGVAAAPYAWLT